MRGKNGFAVKGARMTRPVARIKADSSDSRAEEASRLLREAGCAVKTIPVHAQPYPELLLEGMYYRGMEQIRAIAGKIKTAG